MITMINCRTAPTQAGVYASTHWHTNNNVTKTSAFLSSIGKTSSSTNLRRNVTISKVYCILSVAWCTTLSQICFPKHFLRSPQFSWPHDNKMFSFEPKTNLVRFPSKAKNTSDIISSTFVLRLSLIHWPICWTIGMLALKNTCPPSFQSFHPLVYIALVPVLLAMSNSHISSQVTPSNNKIRITYDFCSSIRKVYEMYS